MDSKHSYSCVNILYLSNRLTEGKQLDQYSIQENNRRETMVELVIGFIGAVIILYYYMP